MLEKEFLFAFVNRARLLVKHTISIVQHPKTRIGLFSAFAASSGYYVVSRWYQLQALHSKISNFEKDVASDDLLHTVYRPLDKLYLMSGAKFSELEQNKKVRVNLKGKRQTWNDLNSQLNQIGWIKKICQQDFEKAKNSLVLTDQRIFLTDAVNESLYYLKKNLSLRAKCSIDCAIEKLEDKNLDMMSAEDTSSQKLHLNHNYLLAHTYNIAAKIARKQNAYDQCNKYYEKALELTPESLEILGSQLALWGDMFWSGKDSSKLTDFIETPSVYQNILERFENSTYSLGLANISWILIQTVEAKSLKLSAPQKEKLLADAFRLADLSVKTRKNKESINGFLFRGISRMMLGQFDLALSEDFYPALQENPDHISLLRRRAMALEKTGQYGEAYWAYQRARVQLRYAKQESPDFPPIQETWLQDIETEKLPEISQKIKQELLTPQAISTKQIIEAVISRDYSSAYASVISSPNALIDKNWFNRHFTIDLQGDDYHFYPKAREDFLRSIGLEAHPSPALFIQLSNLVYNAKQDDKVSFPSEWEEIDRISTNSGYLALACKNRITKQIIICHGGTDPKSVSDLATDIVLAWGSRYKQLEDAAEFTSKVLKKIDNIDTTSIIYHAGHSLGGSIAGYLACTSQPIGKHYAVSFDNPSAWWALSHKYSFDIAKAFNPNEYRNFPITAFLSRPNFINTAGGPHLGKAISIPVFIQDAKPVPSLVIQYFSEALVKLFGPELLDVALKTIKLNIAYHDRHRIRSVFSDEEQGIPENSAFIRVWPSDLKHWKAFEEQYNNDGEGESNLFSANDAQNKVSSNLFFTTPLDSQNNKFLPVNMLEKSLSDLLITYLKKGVKTEKQEKIIMYFDPRILANIKLDERGETFVIHGQLNSWELLAYFRLQLQEACEKENISLSQFLYPRLSEVLIARSVNEPIEVCITRPSP